MRFDKLSFQPACSLPKRAQSVYSAPEEGIDPTFAIMTSIILQGNRGISSSSSSLPSRPPQDGFPKASSSASSSARRRASGSAGGKSGKAGLGGRGSSGGKQSQQRSLQEISIPEGMDEEVRLRGAEMVSRCVGRLIFARWRLSGPPSLGNFLVKYILRLCVCAPVRCTREAPCLLNMGCILLRCLCQRTQFLQ